MFSRSGRSGIAEYYLKSYLVYDITSTIYIHTSSTWWFSFLWIFTGFLLIGVICFRGQVIIHVVVHSYLSYLMCWVTLYITSSSQDFQDILKTVPLGDVCLIPMFTEIFNTIRHCCWGQGDPLLIFAIMIANTMLKGKDLASTLYQRWLWNGPTRPWRYWWLCLCSMYLKRTVQVFMNIWGQRIILIKHSYWATMILVRPAKIQVTFWF